MSARLIRACVVLASLAAAVATLPLGLSARTALLAVAGGAIFTGGEATARFLERRHWDKGERDGEPPPGALGYLSDLPQPLLLGAAGAAVGWALVTAAAASALHGSGLLVVGALGTVLAVGALGALALSPPLSSREPRAPWRHARPPARGTRLARPARRARRGPWS